MTTTINSAMKDNGRRALKGAAVTLSLLVYLAGLLYAGVRSFDLFRRTLPADLLPLAVLGIVAIELTALGLPMAIHYWTSPGAQRLTAIGFYILDLGLIVGNSILDAAHHAGTVLPEFMAAYGVYAVPALPVICMIGWALVWALDPASREADMREQVRAATHEALMSQIMEATKAVDIGDAVRAAAEESARALVGETLGRAPRATLGGHALPAGRMPARQGAVNESPAIVEDDHKPEMDADDERYFDPPNVVINPPAKKPAMNRNGRTKAAASPAPKG